MNHKIGRNDICSCGSGKKYKKCCMKAEKSIVFNIATVDFKWRQIRQLEGAVIDQHLIPYAMEELPEEVFKLALADFFPESFPEDADMEIFLHQFFLPWYLFNWIPDEDFGLEQFDPDKTIAQNYFSFYEHKLNNQEKRFIEAINQSYYSYYSVLEVELGKSLHVKDILLGTTHTLKEKQGTHHIKRGDIIFSRMLTLDDQSIFIGMAPIIIPTGYQTGLIDFRKWLIEENDDSPLTPKALRDEFDVELFESFFDIVQSLFNRPSPILTNTDGNLIQFSKTYFKLKISPEEALNYLLPLTLENDPEELLQEAKRDKSGKIKRLEFPWLVEGNQKHKNWNNTILGHIVLEQSKLILETNSQERTELGQKMLKQYLGDSLSFQNTLIETFEQKMKSLPSFGIEKDEESNKLLELPEVQEQLKAMAKTHWESWFDEPIPMLKDRTPRQSAKTKEGRERLEALLLHYERHDLGREKEDDPFKADISYLKKELGLDP